MSVKLYECQGREQTQQQQQLQQQINRHGGRPVRPPVPAVVEETAGEPRQAWVATVLPTEQERCHPQSGKANK